MILLVFMAWPSSALASEDQIVESAARAAATWEQALGSELLLLGHESVYWVSRTRRVGPVSYDVQKTTSLVSPYKLVISFKAYALSNISGPRKNATVNGKPIGYTSLEAALAATSPGDFVDFLGRSGEGTPITYTAFYAYRKRVWVLNGGSPAFETKFMRESALPQNSKFLTLVQQLPAN
jgi:hypothetical protein